MTKIINIGKMTKKQLRKADRKGSRDAELENSTGWASTHKVHKGKKDMTLFDWVDVDLRLGQETEERVKPRGPGVKMVIVPLAHYPVSVVALDHIPNGREVPPRINLKKDERCQGNFYFDQIPPCCGLRINHKGRTKLRVWAVVGTQISDPVDVDLDLDALRNKRAASPKPWSLNLKKIETEDIQPAN